MSAAQKEQVQQEEEAEIAPEETATAPDAKKQKVVHAPGMKKVAGLANKLKVAKDQLESKKAFVAKKVEQSFAKALTSRDNQAKATAEKVIKELQDSIPKYEAELAAAELHAATLQAAQREKEEKKEEEAEAKRHLSDAGAVYLVELVLG